MNKLHKLKDRLMDVLENDWAEQIMRKPSIGMGDIEMLHKLTDTIKNIDKICMLEEGGYSSAVDGEDYGRGASSTNRGEHWVRGHYSHNGERDGDMGGYSSRRDGRGRYSRDGGRSAMMEHLEMALSSANEQDRENIARFMRQLDDA